ncbi:MAG: toxin-antitoxin system YwqK family antitoxin [Planctomycetota bacterium]
MKPSIPARCLLFAALFGWTGLAPAQDSPELTIKPYTGKAVLLDEGDAPPPANVVRQREKGVDKYASGAVRLEREFATYSDGSRVNNGMYRELYESGQAFVEGAYAMGMPIGEWTYYHSNGQLAKKVTFVDGEIDGEVISYREDGAKRTKRVYAAGKRTGSWINYDETGELALREEKYIDGKKEGMWKSWYPSGQPWRETPFKNDDRHGTAREWNEDGSPRLVAEFVDGMREGASIEWTRDGVKIERRFKAGKLILDE